MSLLRSIILSFFTLFSFSIFAKSPDILIKNATVITSTEIGVLDETDVLIQNGKISLIGENINNDEAMIIEANGRCLLYTSPSPRDGLLSRMPSSA